MNILVLSEDYPRNDGHVTLMYVHTRNIYYLNHGLNVTELNFSAKEDYVYEGIPVISMKSYVNSNSNYDLLVLHAPNLKHHWSFLLKYGHRFAKYLFFFHGHEVLLKSKVYSKPYSYVKSNHIKILCNDIYDRIKLLIWNKYFRRNLNKSWFVFVSKWMLDEFLKWTKIPFDDIKNNYSITYNCVGKEFETAQYDLSIEKEFDFITIRNNLDGSKYCIDLVNKLAQNTPNGKFLVIGKGKFFSFNEISPNITWLNLSLNHDEILKKLNMSRFALMPTRTDAQGLMMCEMAAFGIPVITSDIPVCHEVFEDFKNIFYIDNDSTETLNDFLNMTQKSLKHSRFFEEKTAGDELQLIKHIL